MKKLTDLQIAVIEQMSRDENIKTLEDVSNTYVLENLKDVANYGADGGWTGFTFYEDTVSFFDNNKDLIMKSVKELASDLGDGLLEMISKFNCLNNEYSVDKIAEVIYSNSEEGEYTIKNALSWYALEGVAHQLYDDITEYLDNMEEV